MATQIRQSTGFVYIWYDTIHQWYYIGSHKGDVDDGYVCSSTRMLRAIKKRPNTFKRRILETVSFTDIKTLHIAEQKWLDKIPSTEFMTAVNQKNKSTRYYNIKPHASGGNGVGSNGKMKGHVMYHNPETNECAYSSIPLLGWVIGMPPSVSTHAGKIWIYNSITLEKMLVTKLTSELTSSNWLRGRKPPVKKQKTKKVMTALATKQQAGRDMKTHEEILAINKKISKSLIGKPGSIAVITPDGEFVSYGRAANHFKSSPGTIKFRCTSSNSKWNAWYIKENK